MQKTQYLQSEIQAWYAKHIVFTMILNPGMQQTPTILFRAARAEI
jgi:hypothetical protein